MKYKIEITGRGVDCYVHKITEFQKNDLIDNEIEMNVDSIDDVANILSIDDVFDTDLVHTGFYNDSENYNITIRYVDDNKTLELIEYYFDDYDYTSIYRDDNYLIISDQVKGNILNYEIDIEDEFDIGKLKPVVLDLCENLEIITDFTYDGKDLTDNKEYGDYDSKGFSYYLNEAEDESPEPNEALMSSKEKYEAMLDDKPPYVSEAEDESPEPNEAFISALGYTGSTFNPGTTGTLKRVKEKYEAMLDDKPPYVSDDFQIGPDGAYENIQSYSTPYEDAGRIVSYFKNYRFHISQMDIVIMSTKVADEILMALKNTYASEEIIEHYKSVKEEINNYNFKNIL
jgi:hypothetical protein